MMKDKLDSIVSWLIIILVALVYYLVLAPILFVLKLLFYYLPLAIYHCGKSVICPELVEDDYD